MQRSFTNDKSLFHDGTNTRILNACRQCPDRPLCGGLAIKAPIFNCLDLCQCPTVAERESCSHVCPNQTTNFARRAREVGGYELLLPPLSPVDVPTLPRMIPIMKDKARRTQALDLPAIAVRLDRLFTLKTGMLRVKDRESLAKRLLITNETKVVINSIGFDDPIEHYWSFGRDARLFDQLRQLKPDLVTTPNFSLVTDLPRQSDLHSMKRIAICWHELARAGHSVALHINARTDKDYDRWLKFLNDHSEIRMLAFEFTSGARGNRGIWHKKHLLELSQRCIHPLSLVYRGHVDFAHDFAKSFKQVSVLYAKVYTATLNRQLLEFQKGHPLAWKTNQIPKGAPVDDLFKKNLATASEYVDAAFEGK
jgi:hypothetical protein